MDAKKKPSFIERMKEAVSTKSKSSFTAYTEGEIQSVMVKARLCIDNRFTAASMQLQTEVGRLNGYLQLMESDEYQIVQELADKVVELRGLKMISRMLRKLEESAERLAEARGSIDNIGQELLWLQNVLWAKRAKHIESLQELSQFCHGYFRGVDIADDASLQTRLMPEIRQLSLKSKEIPFDVIHNELQVVLNCASNYPLERKMRMINLNRENIEVLRAMMEEQRIVNETYTPGSSIRMEAESPMSNIKVEAGNTPSVRRASTMGGLGEHAKHNQVYGLPAQKDFNGIDKDELFSLSVVRKFFNGLITQCPQQLRVRPFQN